MKRLIAPYIILFMSCGCSMSSNSPAVSFLWNDEPLATSSRIMVISELEGAALRREAVLNLESLGFVIDQANEERIETEPHTIRNRQMRLLLELSNNTVIISGEQGGEGNWSTISRGEEEFATPEWDTMEVLATAIDGTTIKFD